MKASERIIERVKKLRAHAENGRTMEEQATFAAKVQELMIQYELSEAMVSDVAIDATGEVVGTDTWIDDDGSFLVKDRKTFLPLLAVTVANAHNCRIVVVTGSSAAKIHFVGRARDRAVAVYMFDYLAHAALRALKTRRPCECGDGKGDPHPGTVCNQKHPGDCWCDTYRPVRLTAKVRDSFLHGFVVCLDDRYREQHARLMITAEASAHDRALVRTSDALALIEKTIGDMNIDGEAKASSNAEDLDAAIDGYDAATSINLTTRAVEGSNDANVTRALYGRMRQIEGGR